MGFGGNYRFLVLAQRACPSLRSLAAELSTSSSTSKKCKKAPVLSQISLAETFGFELEEASPKEMAKL